MRHAKNFIKEASLKHPDKIAFIFDDQKVTFAELDSIIEKTAKNLSDLGIKKGDQILLPLPNSLNFIVLLFSILKNDAIAFPISPDIHEDELNQLVNGINYPIAIIDPEITVWAVEKFKTLSRKTLQVKNNYEISIISENPEMNAIEIGNENEYLFRIMSSGSSGVRKQMHQNNMAIQHLSESAVAGFGLNGDDVMLNITQPIHILGIGQIFMATSLGCTTIIEKEVIPAKIKLDIEKFKVTWLATSPFIFDLISKSPDDKHIFSSLRLVVNSGAPITENVFKQLQDNCGVNLSDMYGSSETLITTTNLNTGKFEQGLVGKPVPGAIVKIFDDNKNELPTGEVGKIGVSGPSTIKGYIDNPQANEDHFIGPYILIGDKGYMDENGNLHLVGRSNLVVNVAGKKVDIIEVENVLCQNPNVNECAVYGLTQGSTDIVVAAVILNKEISDKELMNWCAQKLLDYKIPKRIAFVDSLPRASTGKIIRSEIVNLFL